MPRIPPGGKRDDFAETQFDASEFRCGTHDGPAMRVFLDRLLHEALVRLFEPLFGNFECRIDHPDQTPDQRFSGRIRNVIIFV